MAYSDQKKINDLRMVCYELYQVLGAMDAPQRVLDYALAAGKGRIKQYSVLPFTAPEKLPDDLKFFKEETKALVLVKDLLHALKRSASDIKHLDSEYGPQSVVGLALKRAEKFIEEKEETQKEKAEVNAVFSGPQASMHVGCHVNTIYIAANKGLLVADRTADGRGLLIKQENLEAWFSQTKMGKRRNR